MALVSLRPGGTGTFGCCGGGGGGEVLECGQISDFKAEKDTDPLPAVSAGLLGRF